MSVIFKDTFTDTNGVLIENHTPDFPVGSNKWQEYGGNEYYINNNSLQYKSGSTWDLEFAGYDVGVSDFTLTFTLNAYSSGGGTPYVVFRATDSSHFIAYRINNGHTNSLVYVNGADSFLSIANGTKNYTYAVGDTFTITCSGNTIKISINGVQDISAISTFNQTATIIGFDSQHGTTQWDNVEVDSVGSSSSGTTYIGSGTSQGTSSATSNETLILSPRTYAGNGVSTGISSLTTNDKIVENVGGNSNGQSNLTTNEIKLYSASGNVNGASSLTTTESIIGHSTTTYSASGTSQGNVSLSSAEHLIINTNGSSSQGTPPDTTTIDGTSSVISNENYIYSANGSTSATSVVSSVGNVIYVDFGNSNGQSNLTTSEQLVSPTGTTYSESGQSSGLSYVSGNDKVTYESSVSVNGQSTVTTTEHESLSAQGSVQGQSSATSTEQFVGHATTTYSGMGSSDGTSNVTSSETKSHVASGSVNGTTNVTSYDNVVYFPSGMANGYTTITTSERYVSVFEVVGIIELNGQIQLTLQFVGVIDLNITLKGVV